ncbi:MAG: PIN domain-containing protein, partial [Verrucomicrobia bacterium]|nr:PIN domain-containing protein [Verrucomicrobiota bacterium]
MRFTADSSVLARLYLDEEAAETIQGFLADDGKVVSVSELARVEVLNVLLRDPDLGAAARFEEDLAAGDRLRLETVDWPDAFQQAESLARRFARTLRPGG